jgi:FG-GAP-like repeat
MGRILFFVLLFQLFTISVFGSETIQSDWSGGDGLIGPVSEWGDRFDTATAISWRSVPGQLALSSAAMRDPVFHTISNAYVHPFGLEVVDIDFDGDIDVLGCAEESNLVLLWLNNGDSPLTWTETIIDNDFPGGTEVYPADIDNDGDWDVIAASETGGNRVAWWRNDGGDPIQWQRFIVDSYFPVACSAYPSDVDGDGLLDILSTSWTASDVAWYHNSGTDPIVWTKQIINTSFGGAHLVRTGDLDDDGDMDVVAAAGSEHKIAWYQNDGGTPISWTERTIVSSYSGARACEVADIDGDGRLDVVGTSWNRYISWWRNAGGDPIQWQRQDISNIVYGGHSVNIADVDGDGRLDVLGVGWNAGLIGWWRNTGGDPIEWTENIIADDYPNALWVRTADLDNDGDLDVVSTASASNSFDWWEITEFGSAGELHSSILDIGFDPDGAAADWSVSEPAGTSCQLEFRTGSDPYSLGSWFSLGTPGEIPADVNQYVQYKAIMSTTDPSRSPLLTDFTGTWAAGAAVDPNPPIARGFNLYFESPSKGHARIEFKLDEAAPVTLDLFDPSGRLAVPMVNDVRASGRHSVTADNLATGIYLCRLSVAGKLLTRRLIVIE